MDDAFYKDKYGYILQDGFQNKSSVRKKFFKATQNYDNGAYDAALHLLFSLEKKCSNEKEHTAVFLMEGLCYNQKEMWNHAISAYQIVLEQEPTYSRAWSNLGHVYFTIGKCHLAKEAYCKAITYDAENEYAYVNLAVLYLQMGEYEQALAYALRALQYDQRFAAAAYANPGNVENAIRYCNLYSMCGGDFACAKKMVDHIFLSRNRKE